MLIDEMTQAKPDHIPLKHELASAVLATMASLLAARAATGAYKKFVIDRTPGTTPLVDSI